MPKMLDLPITIARRFGRAIRKPGDEAVVRLFESFRLNPDERHRIAGEYPGELAKVFFGPKTRLVDKWLHYLDIYEQHFGLYRGADLKMLELGVFKGGSLEMWYQYFGPNSTIYGVDIDPACAAYETANTHIRIGSQDDAAFLRTVIAEMGTPDIIIDDGSHIAKHQEASFRVLFPMLKDGGLYVIEDLHTAYWRLWGGGYRRKGSAIELVKHMIDDMHAWYHDRPVETPAKTEIGAIHIYDSVVFIKKVSRRRPTHIRIPATGD